MWSQTWFNTFKFYVDIYLYKWEIIKPWSASVNFALIDFIYFKCLIKILLFFLLFLHLESDGAWHKFCFFLFVIGNKMNTGNNYFIFEIFFVSLVHQIGKKKWQSICMKLININLYLCSISITVLFDFRRMNNASLSTSKSQILPNSFF